MYVLDWDSNKINLDPVENRKFDKKLSISLLNYILQVAIFTWNSIYQLETEYFRISSLTFERF
jgi:hypothetical protein